MESMPSLPATASRVRHQTSPALNRAVRDRCDAALLRLEHAPPEAVTRHLAALDREWDVERALQANASVIVLTGLALALAVNRRFLLLPAAVFGFFAQHALQGWCPPLPVLRRLGFRTAGEIERERYAVKALRGDFEPLPPAAAPMSERVRAALAAVDA